MIRIYDELLPNQITSKSIKLELKLSTPIHMFGNIFLELQPWGCGLSHVTNLGKEKKRLSVSFSLAWAMGCPCLRMPPMPTSDESHLTSNMLELSCPDMGWIRTILWIRPIWILHKSEVADVICNYKLPILKCSVWASKIWRNLTGGARECLSSSDLFAEKHVWCWAPSEFTLRIQSMIGVTIILKLWTHLL